MASVRCPACSRLLRLPDGRQDEARCPLCGKAFPLLGAAAPLPIPDRAARAVPAPPAVAAPAADVAAPSRSAARDAAAWLKATAVVGLLQAMVCGMCDCVERLDRGRWGSALAQWLAAQAVVRLVVFVAAYAAAENLPRYRRHGVVVLGCVGALLYGGGTFLWAIPSLGRALSFVFVGGPVGQLRGVGCFSFLLTEGLAVLALVAGVKGLRVLGREEVRRAFEERN